MTVTLTSMVTVRLLVSFRTGSASCPFASVQNRLREWHPSVRERLIRHSCMVISAFDIDGFRYDTDDGVQRYGQP